MEPGYPAAPRADATDNLNGVRIPDPYRWLEDPGSGETGEWLAGQDALYAAYRDGWPRRAGFAERLTELMAAGMVSPPVWRGSRRFFLRRGPGQEHAVLLTADGDGPERVLIDPMQVNPDGTTTLDAWQPDKEGRLLAYQLSEGGAEESVLRVMSPFVLLSGLAPLFSTTIDYLGGARRRIPIAAATLFVNVTINLVLLRRIGPVAAAIAVDAGYVVFVFGHAFVATRLLGLDLRSIGRTLAAITLAATLMTAAVGLIRTLSGGVPVTVVAGIAGSCLFAAAVVVSRQHRGLLNGGG